MTDNHEEESQPMPHDNDDSDASLPVLKTMLTAQGKTLDEIKSLLSTQNGRLRAVELGEAGCPARGADLPERVGTLENEVAETRGAAREAREAAREARSTARAGQIGGLAGGGAIIMQLVQIVAALLGK